MKRTLLLGTAWTASAASAVGLGFLAVSLVDASASPGTVPLAAASTATASEDGAATPSPAPVTATGEQGDGGRHGQRVLRLGHAGALRCAGRGLVVDDSDDPGQVEFENGSRSSR